MLGELHDPHSVFLDPAATEPARREHERPLRRRRHPDGRARQRDHRRRHAARDAGRAGGHHVGRPHRRDRRQVDARSDGGGSAEDASRTGRQQGEGRWSSGRASTAPLTFTLTRRDIQVNPVQHALLLPDGVGYVDLTVFSSRRGGRSRPRDRLASLGRRALARARPARESRRPARPGHRRRRSVPRRGAVDRLDHGPERRREPRVRRSRGAALGRRCRSSCSPTAVRRRRARSSPARCRTTTARSSSAPRRTEREARSGCSAFEDGAVKLTTALWYTPSGRSINRARTVGRRRRTRTAAVDCGQHQATGVQDRRRPHGARRRRDRARRRGAEPRRLEAREGAAGQRSARRCRKFRDAMVDYAIALKTSGSIIESRVRRHAGDARRAVSAAAGTRRRGRARGLRLGADAREPRARRRRSRDSCSARRPSIARTLREDADLAKARELLRGVSTPAELVQRRNAERRREGAGHAPIAVGAVLGIRSDRGASSR